MAPHKDLGSILVDEGVIGQKDLDRLDLKGRPLWAALLEAKLTSEDELFFLMAQRYGAPVLSEEVIAETKMPHIEQLRRALTREQALASGILPIDFASDGKRVTVLMVDPSDEKSLAAFLTRAQVPEGRALLGRRSAVERAIDRCYRAQAPPRTKPMPDEPTGTVKLDPELAAEIKRMPASALKGELTPQPQVLPHEPRKPRPRKPTPQPQPAAVEPPSTEHEQRADERFTRALLQAVEALARELELRLGAAGADESGRVGRAGSAGEMARLARRVARELGLQRRAAEEIGVAAQLFAIDTMMRQVDGSASSDVFADLGWPAAAEGGLVPILRALTAASSGFGRATQTTPPLGARIIGVVADYLELGAAAGEADLDTVSQLLRASSAGAPVVDALLRVLETERGDKSSSSGKTLITAAPATSLLREPDSGETELASDDNKTQKKAVPQPRPGPRREPSQE